MADYLTASEGGLHSRMQTVVSTRLPPYGSKALLTRQPSSYIVAVTKRAGGPFWLSQALGSSNVPLRRVVTITCLAVSLVLAAGKYFPSTVRAGIGFQPVSPEELKMTSEPLAPGAPAVILYRQVDVDDNGRTSHEDNYVRVKILTDEGRNYGSVEIAFFKESTDIVGVHARTVRPDGSTAEFDGKVFEKWVAKGGGRKYLVKSFTLPDVQAGSVIEYYYTVDLKEHMVFNTHWILSHELFTKKARFSLKPFGYFGGTSVPLHIRWSWHDLPPGADPKEGPDRVVRMEANNIPAFETEDHMPPANDMKARVDFVYSEDLPDKNAEEFWKRIGKKRNGQLESFVGKHKSMEEAVAQMVSPNDAPEVKLRKIYDRVQQIRNTSYELRKTEQEKKRDKEKIDENVEDVWKRGYGNGKQLTWLYLALVRAAGFEAYGAWVSDRYNYFFTRVTMEPYRLDANVVIVKLNGKDLYFDPGGRFAPFGMLEWTETGVQGLRLDKDGGTWIQTPLPPSSESRLERVAKLKLSDTGDLEGKLTVTYTGLEAMYHRLDVRHADEVARKKSLEERIVGQVPAAVTVELTNHPDWDSSETPLVAEFDIKIQGWASNAGKRALIPAGVFTAGEKHVFEHANRVHPIYFDYPYEKVDDVTIELPPGWQVGGVPAAKDQDAHVVAYSRKVENGKDTLHMTRKLKVDFMILEAKYYPALRSFYELVRTGDEEQIVLQPAPAKASN
jgi:transglutaminase-like putative cysteine protease